VGIDVSKETLQLALRPGEEQRTVPAAAGWTQLQRWLHRWTIRCLVVDATGPSHVGRWLALGEAGFPVAVVNPGWTKAYGQSLGQRAKTDSVDARLLARDADERQPAPTPMPRTTVGHLKELVSCREDLVKLRVMEQHRQQMATAVSQSIHDVVLTTLRVPR